jgi:hypothetical protein
MLCNSRDPAPDHGDIGVSRADIGNKTFPFWLPDQTKTDTLTNRGMDTGIPVNGFNYRGEIHVKAKILFNK